MLIWFLLAYDAIVTDNVATNHAMLRPIVNITIHGFTFGFTNAYLFSLLVVSQFQCNIKESKIHFISILI